MTRPEISGIAPFFIVTNVPAALAFYRDRLGFDTTKDIGVDPVPNYTRDIKQGIARWDAYLECPGGRVLVAPGRVLHTS